MNTIKVTHLDKNNKPLDNGFIASLPEYKAVNKGFDWDLIITTILNSGEYVTSNLAYGNIRFSFK